MHKSKVFCEKSIEKPNTKTNTSPLVFKIVYGGHSLDHIEPVKWGRDHEKDAREDFVRTTSPKLKNFCLKTCGLFVHKYFPYIAASPDVTESHDVNVVGMFL